MEHWELDLENRSKKTQYPRALAAAVRELLDDPAVRVRDQATGEVRRARPGDVAILCRRHLTARRVAAALGEQGVRAALPRPGLCDTLEVRVALAGLRLWIDPAERLARAEVGRILRDAEDDGLLEALVSAKAAGVAVRLPELERVEERRAELADAGPLEALDHVLDALGLRDRCHCWGSSDQRLANLDALRALVARHAETCRAQRVACTVPGAVAFVEESVANEEDGRAVVAADAVVVSTWHAAKGLEWPITVLFDLEWSRTRHDWGVKVGFEAGEFDPAEPLRGRWIRFWPTPYRWNQKQPPFYERLQNHPITVRAMQEDKKEQLRLLYVGWTRARDRVVLAAPRGKLNDGILGELRGTNGLLIADPVERTAWNGREVTVAVRHAMPAEPRPLEQVPDPGYPARPAREYPARVTQPSTLAGADARVVEETIGDTLDLRSGADPVALGNAIHSFLAVDIAGLDQDRREALAERVIEAWDVAGALEASALLAVGETFAGWIASRWPGGEISREVPLESRSTDGSRVRGVVDCVVDTGDGWVIIDHKVLRGAERPGEAALAFGGQLGAYVAVLEQATGKPVQARYIHLPLNGCVVGVDDRSSRGVARQP